MCLPLMQSRERCRPGAFIPGDVLKRYKDHLYYSEDAEGNRVLSGIWLSGNSLLHEAGYYSGAVLLGVASNAQNLDNSVLMVTQLLYRGKCSFLNPGEQN